MKLPRKHLGRYIPHPVALAAMQLLAASFGVAQAQTVAAPAAAASAPAADADAPQSIVITARRVNERLQDVPISVSAFNAAQIESAGLRQMEDVARLTPGFSFERSTGALAQPAIRGQAQYRVTNPVQNVATYLNGIYLQRSYQVDSDLLGLDRIEVIKGPQSALFGRNAFAGAISYITQRPDLQAFKLRGEATFGSDDRREYKAMVSAPFGGQAALSVNLSTSKFDGTWEDSNTLAAGLSGPGLRTKGNLNGWDNQSALVQLRVAPTDNVEINAFWNHREIFIESPANYQMGPVGLVAQFNTLNCKPFEAALQPVLGTNALWCGALPARPTLAPGEQRSPGLVGDRRAYSQDGTTNVYGLTIDAAFSDAWAGTLTIGETKASNVNNASLTRDPERGIIFPGPFNGLALLDSRGNGTIDSESVEARLTYDSKKLRAMVGLFTSSVSDVEYGGTYIAPANGTAELSTALFPVGNLFFPGFTTSRRDEEINSIFGSIGGEVLPGLRVTAEGRQTSETIVQQAVTYPSLDPAGPALKKRFRYFTPRLTGDYKLNPNMLVFASAAQGIKSGGFNPSAIVDSDLVYEPEKNWTYELGLKSNTADGNILFNASVYHVDWTNLQVNRPVTGGTLGSPLVVGNVSGAKVNGVEAQLRWRLLRTLTLDVGGSHARARYNGDAFDPTIPRALCAPPAAPTCPFSGDIGGNTVARAPASQANVGLTWRGPVPLQAGSGLTLTARGDVSYQSKAYVDPTNTSWVPARTLVNGSIGVEGRQWSLRLWGRNLLDKEYVSTSFATFGAVGAGTGAVYAPLLGDGRSVGMTLGLNY